MNGSLVQLKDGQVRDDSPSLALFDAAIASVAQTMRFSQWNYCMAAASYWDTIPHILSSLLKTQRAPIATPQLLFETHYIFVSIGLKIGFSSLYECALLSVVSREWYQYSRMPWRRTVHPRLGSSKRWVNPTVRAFSAEISRPLACYAWRIRIHQGY